ncbi:SDR family oxidoreductase [Bacillus luteolus]|uniref:SDR family oxidoreductase n=1 Tax=Litchfieldia luteola TaxID=682179 RepID=A0ABR9QQD0_9BACI|nr:SDR family oxidoreductase [Cytobacillus luteolus]MBE4910394.1 SDR family oxidoreductase [Cytobacillus luteolus]MBP1942030.1 short-subunit dehydrogenase [Cytobacillus luteolus]
MGRLNGKIVVITGASSGIGERIAYLAAEQGATPILLARSYKALEEIASTIKQRYNVPCAYYELDVSNTVAVGTVFNQILSEHKKVDVLVNNAGFGVFENVIDTDLSKIESMFDVNVLGLVACTKMVLPQMIERNTGHIINIASQAGKISTPKSSVYSATKHAVLGFTNGLRLELANSNVFVTAVNPGPIKTRFFEIADESGNYVKNVEKFMLDPDFVARKVVNTMLIQKRELNLPGWMNMGSIFYYLFPTTFEKIGKKTIFKK